LDADVLATRVGSDKVQVRRYDDSLFSQLPENAHRASTLIPTFFGSVVESHSHWSDLIRLAVLFQYGGVWTDFDSLWVDSVEAVSPAEAWVPLSPGKLTGWDLINDDSFIEGGLMRFPPKHPFIERALQTFPEYTEDVAKCWACVGPRHLTNTYINMEKESQEVPATVPSAQLFGGKYYRSNLPKMHSELNLNAVQPNSVAFHLFTSTGEFDIQKNSLIDFLFRSAGVEVEAKASVEHISLGKLSQRRRQLQSVEGSDTYTPVGYRDIGAGFCGCDGEMPPACSSMTEDQFSCADSCNEADGCAAFSTWFMETGNVCRMYFPGVMSVECPEGFDARESEAYDGQCDDWTIMENTNTEVTGSCFVAEDVEPEEPSMYVSSAEFMSLADRVAALETSMTYLEGTVQQVDDDMTTMATCMSSYGSEESTTDDDTTDTETREVYATASTAK